jgi:hypothetical protein
MKTVEKQDSAGFGRLFSGSAMGSRITQKLRGFADPAIGSRLGFRMFSSRTLKKMKKKVLLERKGTQWPEFCRCTLMIPDVQNRLWSF